MGVFALYIDRHRCCVCCHRCYRLIPHQEARARKGYAYAYPDSRADYEKYQAGYWIIAKCDLHKSNLQTLMRPVVMNALGQGAVVMPETAASHLTTVFWTGNNTCEPAEIPRVIVGLLRAEVLT